MTKTDIQRIKREIAYEFGFQPTKIKLLGTTGFTATGEIKYVRFEVCSIEYVMRFDYIQCTYCLEVTNTLGLVTIN